MFKIQKNCLGETLVEGRGRKLVKHAFFMAVLLADDHNICKLIMSGFSYVGQ